MEYEIDNESKVYYPADQIYASLKRDEQKANKKTPMQIPPGGMGNGLERAYSKLFLLPVVKISAK